MLVCLTIQFEKHQRLCLQLLHIKCAQGLRASQDDQGGEKKSAADGLNGAPRQAEEGCEKREAPVDRLEQLIEEQCHSDIDRDIDEEGCEA